MIICLDSITFISFSESNIKIIKPLRSLPLIIVDPRGLVVHPASPVEPPSMGCDVNFFGATGENGLEDFGSHEAHGLNPGHRMPAANWKYLGIASIA